MSDHRHAPVSDDGGIGRKQASKEEAQDAQRERAGRSGEHLWRCGRKGYDVRHWRNPLLLIAVTLACMATLALTALPSAIAPRPGSLPLRDGPGTARLPVSLAPSASATIGASERSFWPVRQGSALMAQGGGIHSTFTPSGIRVRAAHGALYLRLAGVGRGQRAVPISAAVPTGAANEVLYRHGSITEFYRNGPYGLEQGFTVRHRPQRGAGSLVLALSVAGPLVPKKAGSQVLFRTSSGAAALRYGHLSALDATGRRLPAHIQVRNGSLELRIDDSSARYPLRIDPFLQQANLTPSDALGFGWLGVSAALSADGNTALIGGPRGGGAAWVFTRTGSTWSEQARLTGGGEVGEGEFGSSVALSADGNTALVGASRDNDGHGAIWVFVRSGSTWRQQGEKLTGGGESGRAHFGSSVALSADGNTALIGGPRDNPALECCEGPGAAWVFTRSGSTWTQQGEKLTGGRESGLLGFGSSVALSADGSTALIGGWEDNRSTGAAWVFVRSGSTWTQQARLTGGGEVGRGSFGSSVALSADGNTALVGGPTDNPVRDCCEGPGAAWVFTRAGSTWTQQGEKLTGGESGLLGFGSSVALSADANTALIDGRVFVRAGSSWIQQGEKLTSGGPVALSADGNTALVGAPGDNPGATCCFEYRGAARVFTRSGATWTQQGEKLTVKGESGGIDLGSAVALSSDGKSALIGAPGDNEGVGAVWVFTRKGSTWTQQAKLTGGGEIGKGEFGRSVALAADGKTALIGAPEDNNRLGAAWVFTRSGSTWKQRGPKLIGTDAGGSQEEAHCDRERGSEFCFTGHPARFGVSVALSSNGSTAVVGDPGDNEHDGAAWVFTRKGSTWVQQGEKLTGAGEQNVAETHGGAERFFHLGGRFGASVALSRDGDTVLIGGPRDNQYPGAAWMFTRSGQTWTQQGEKLAGSGETCVSEEGIGFGESVALSADGNTALVGEPGDGYQCHRRDLGSGSAWAYTRSGSTWTQQGEKLENHQAAPELEFEDFGSSLALSSNGNTALIKGGEGRAWVFTRVGSSWTEQVAPLTCGEGCEATLSGNASTALVGTAVFVNSAPHGAKP